MKRLFYFFIDGLGLAPEGPDNHVTDLFRDAIGGHPLVASHVPLDFDGGVLVPLDAIQGVPGIPQSATGQTSLYTGVNAQKVVGYHLTAFPNRRLMRLIRERSLLKWLVRGDVSVTSANFYTEEFFQRRSARRKNMFPVSTLSIKAAELPFRMEEEYKEGKAIFADITNRMLKERGIDLPSISPAEGAQRIYRIIQDHQAVFFEYFMTDIYGHKRNEPALENRKRELNEFLSALLALIKEDEQTSILIVSDHGNVEDFSTGDHTLNKIPLILFSREKELLAAARRCSRLSDTYYMILDHFGISLPF